MKPDHWYKAELKGHNPTEKFMGHLSTACNLSDSYTNHCIRVTDVTNLTRSGHFSARQVMSVSSHKSIQSLANYQRVKEDEKLMIGMSLTYCLLQPSEVVGIKEVIQQKQIQQEKEKLTALPSSKLASIMYPPFQAVPIQNAVAPINHQRFSTSTPPVPISVPEPHALDPNVPQLLPLDDALVPYSKQQEKGKSNGK